MIIVKYNSQMSVMELLSHFLETLKKQINKIPYYIPTIYPHILNLLKHDGFLVKHKIKRC